MAEANPDDQQPDTNPAGSGEESAEDQENKGSDKPSAQPDQSDTVKKLQSERDQLRARLEKVESVTFGAEVEKTMSKFLSDNASKYPDLEPEDLIDAESLDPKDLEAVAKKKQDRFDRARNKAIVDAQNTPDNAMTEEEQAKALDDLKKKPKKSFSDYLNIKLAPRK